jgi:hypothetical protein
MPETDADAEKQAGTVFADRFEILAFVRGGGMGDVYCAKDRTTERLVAVKVLRGLETVDLLRFERESRLLSTLAHPAIVEYVAHGEFEGTPYLAMEWLEGEDLAERLARGPLGADETRQLGERLAGALARAHAVGVVHRDIKPSNVFLRDGDVRKATILDFGVALAGASDGLAVTLTRSGTLLGTLAYMAPEQARGAKSVDPRADVFSLGCVLFECLTGRRAFAGAHAVEVLAQILTEPAPRPGDVAPNVPADLDDLVVRMLAKDPAERPADCREVEQELRHRKKRARPRRWWALGAVVAGAAAITAAPFVARKSATPAVRQGAPAPRWPFHPVRPRRITFDEGCAEFPSFTPDGKSLVYDATVGKSSYIFERPLDGGERHQLTTVDGWDMAGAVSPDGSRVAFMRATGGTQALMIAERRLGAAPKILVPAATARPTWSRDGRSIWTSGAKGLERYDAESGALLEAVALPAAAIALRSLELSEGRRLLAIPPVRGSGESGVAILGADRTLTWLLRGDIDEVLLATPDGQRALAVRITSTDQGELMELPLDGAPPTSLANTGVGARKGMDLSPDGRRVAWSTCSAITRLVAPLPDGGATPFLADWKWDEFDVAVIPGTTRAVVLSSRAGTLQPWVVDLAAGAAPRPIDVGDLRPIGVAVSDDGAWIAVSVFGHGLHAVKVDGSAPPRAATATTHDFSPSFVHGTHDVLFHTVLDDGQAQIRRISLDAGGEPAIVLERDARAPSAAPHDDRVLYLAGENVKQLVPMIFDPRTRRSTKLSPSLAAAAYTVVRFTPDGRRCILLKSEPEQLEVDLATSATRSISLEAIGVGFVRGQTVFAVPRWEGDVWIADAPFGE